jgi:urease accessory protein
MSAPHVIPVLSDRAAPRGRAAAPGCGRVTIAAHGGRSRVTRAYAASPLRLLTPKNHGPASWIYTSTFGGGLVGGDAFHLEVDVREGAMAYLATQAATKVYRSPAATSVELEAAIGRGAVLVVAPDPVVCFAGSSYRQHQRFDLHERGSLVFVDWMSSGRHASGERWQFDRYDSRLVIRHGGRDVVHDALLLTPGHGRLAERLGRFNVLLVAAMIGPAFDRAVPEVVAQVEALAVGPRSRLIVGASRVTGGCVLRMAGVSVEEVGARMRAMLACVPSLLGDDPWARKW